MTIDVDHGDELKVRQQDKHCKSVSREYKGAAWVR